MLLLSLLETYSVVIILHMIINIFYSLNKKYIINLLHHIFDIEIRFYC